MSHTWSWVFFGPPPSDLLHEDFLARSLAALDAERSARCEEERRINEATTLAEKYRQIEVTRRSTVYWSKYAERRDAR